MPRSKYKKLLKAIRNAFAAGNVMWRTHAQQRMLERDIGRKDINAAIAEGEIIEAYETDKPFPSYLIYGKSAERVLHIVIAWNADKEIAYVITAYEPDEQHFDTDLRSRKRRNRHDEDS